MNEKKQMARRYDREFKENAVALVQSGRTISGVARDFGGDDLVAGALGATRQGGRRAARAGHPGRRE